MFDIGFAELLLVSVVGLLVLGPERLPGAIRTGSLWLGKLRRGFNNIRAEVEREINVEDIKREIHNDAIMQSLKAAEQDLKGAIPEIPYDISDVARGDDSAKVDSTRDDEQKPS
jgi:sec-independent protein translocase protein TatB